LEQTRHHHLVFNIKVEANNMHRTIGPAAGKLDTRAQAEVLWQSLLLPQHLLEAGDSIVIGNRKLAYAGTQSLDNKLLWRKSAIGGITMAVKINYHGHALS
jgi:hypothetical protein